MESEAPRNVLCVMGDGRTNFRIPRIWGHPPNPRVLFCGCKTTGEGKCPVYEGSSLKVEGGSSGETLPVGV